MYKASHELTLDSTPVVTFVHFIKTFLLVIYDKYLGYSMFFFLTSNHKAVVINVKLYQYYYIQLIKGGSVHEKKCELLSKPQCEENLNEYPKLIHSLPAIPSNYTHHSTFFLLYFLRLAHMDSLYIASGVFVSEIYE